MKISEELARFICQTSYSDLPEEVVVKAKALICDTLAAGWAGAASPLITNLQRLTTSDALKGEAAIWGSGTMVSARDATLINGAAAAVLDYDSVHLRGGVHSAVVALPASLSMAQRQHATGRDFLTAFVVGNELICRLAMSTPEKKGWFYTSVHGVFGAAASAAKLLDLGVEATQNALGIALAQAAGTQQAGIERRQTKALQSAFAAQAGVLSGLLAGQGVTGALDSFEGRSGLYGLYATGNRDVLLDQLGTRYEMLDTTIKQFPSCACNHTAILATLELIERHAVDISDVQHMEVVISAFAHRLIGSPYTPGDQPQIDAQFSVQYAIASALLRGRPGIRDTEAPAATDPSVLALARRIHVIADRSRDGARAMSAEVGIGLRGGDFLRHSVEAIPESPSLQTLALKQNDCLSIAQDHGLRIPSFLTSPDELEYIHDMQEIFAP